MFYKRLGHEIWWLFLAARHNEQKGTERNGLKKASFHRLVPLTLFERLPDEVGKHETDEDNEGSYVHGHGHILLEKPFSTVLLPRDYRFFRFPIILRI